MDRHSVMLTVWSAATTAADLASQLGIEPDECWDRGDVGPGGRPHERSALRFGSGLPDETSATEQVSALLARTAGSAARFGDLAVVPGTEVTLSIGYFVNEPQWQEDDDGTLVRGLGVSLSPAQIEFLHAMRAHFDVDLYVNVDG